MAFQDFSRYIFGFSALDTKMPDIIDQRKYYDRWMCKYSYIFSSDDNHGHCKIQGSDKDGHTSA